MLLSVIIPTLHRPESLMRQLQSLQAQTLPQFEIVVVDNAADAILMSRLAVFNQTACHPVHYVPEPRRGLMEARHAGAHCAKGDVLVYVDDDQTTAPGALEAYAHAFATYSEMAAAGGPVGLAWEAPPPQWLLDYMQPTPTMFPLLGFLDLGQEFTLDPRGILFGGNLAIRRTVLFQIGGFNPELVGTRCVGDGEVGLYRKLWEQGLLIGYVPEAKQVQYLPPHRMTVAYLRQRVAHDGASDMYTVYHPGIPSRWRLVQHAAHIAVQNAKYWLGGLPFYGRTDPWSINVQLRAARTRAQGAYLLRLCYDRDLRQLVRATNWLEAFAPASAPTPRPIEEEERAKVRKVS
jgi:glucosyl-dolichyl phosphate glucuronosyltransferase